MSYTSADHRFDAEHAHGWKPAKWVDRWYCGHCDREFNVVMTRGIDDYDHSCPTCGADDTSSC